MMIRIECSNQINYFILEKYTLAIERLSSLTSEFLGFDSDLRPL